MARLIRVQGGDAPAHFYSDKYFDELNVKPAYEGEYGVGAENISIFSFDTCSAKELAEFIRRGVE